MSGGEPGSLDRDAGQVAGGSADRGAGARDITPALGTRAEPGSYRRAEEGAEVALHGRRFGDALWSYLFKADTGYAAKDVDDGAVRAAARRARGASEVPGEIQGPVMHPAVWTWEVPLYFWLGGIAAGSSSVSLGSDLAGDHRSAVIARRVALAAAAPCPLLLISDLGRPARFLNMLRIFKPRSPMSMGAWCLSAFGSLSGMAVGADLLRRPRAARGIGAANALLGAYLGSYSGALLASTATPVWARSRALLGPMFAATATATGAAATRLALAGTGMASRHPTQRALARVETGAMAAEVALARLNHRRLGRLASAVDKSAAGRLFKAAEGAVAAGLVLRLARRRVGPRVHHLPSLLYLAGGLAFRYGWVRAGRASATDDEAVSLTARRRATRDQGTSPGSASPFGSRPLGRTVGSE